MELSNVTLQDCVEMMQFKGMAATVNDGELLGFEEEEQE